MEKTVPPPDPSAALAAATAPANIKAKVTASPTRRTAPFPTHKIPSTTSLTTLPLLSRLPARLTPPYGQAVSRSLRNHHEPPAPEESSGNLPFLRRAPLLPPGLGTRPAARCHEMYVT